MIKLENVSKSFGDLEVLKDISIEIADHEIFGIIGQSGAGKSTLLRCINGLEDYQSGRIEVDGVEVSLKDKKKLHLLQKNMGMIFQNFNLLERLDVYDNVALPMKFWGMKTKTPEARKKIEGLISLVGLEDKIHARPKELSGGQKQRVAIARALVLDPKILLCDEATSALDPAITRGILDLLQKINKEMGITIIVVTHQMEVVKQICEKVAFIKNGRVVQIGKPEELFIRPNKDIKAFLHEDSELLPEEGVNIQLFFTDESADEPVISNMARKLDADFSISWAKLEDFRSHVYGSLVINIKEKDKEKITAYLDEVKVLWEVLN
ncbi:MAG: methionine ABC transporter ATP-binding protein [Erysipelotrichaceae bacterium]|nr:methionine ABC transporter ATP-binding protein [Erysipelotrichaceae bacterium]MBQ4020161.1 methionine ABC transporter ATP-binding protein [Erysipelotrichaceae bacterium]